MMASVLLLACSPVPVGEGEDGGVTTDPSGDGGVTTLGPDDTTGEEPPNPTGTSTTGPSPTGDPPPPPILDMGGGGGLGQGESCIQDSECASNHCYVIPFLGGQCGECNEDADCPDGGCTAPNPFDTSGAVCNMGEVGAGCESDAVCQGDLVCDTIMDLLGLIQITTCGSCSVDADCLPEELCAPVVELFLYNGANTCILPGSLGQDSYCDLDGTGAQACQSGVCSVIDIMGLAESGACGECLSNADCGGGTCFAGEFNLDTGSLSGSTCQ